MKPFRRWTIAWLAVITFLAPLKFGTPVVSQWAATPPQGWFEWLMLPPLVNVPWPNQIAIILVFATLSWLALDPGRLAARVDLLFVLPLIFLGTQLLAWPSSINRQTSSETVLLFATCILLYYAAAWYARDGATAGRIFGGLGLASFLVIVEALIQYFGGLQDTREFAAHHLDPATVPPQLLWRMTSNRVFAGFGGYPNALAGFLVVAFAPTLAWIWVRSRGWDVRMKWLTLVFVGGVMIYCLLLTGSRGGFVAFGMMVLAGLACLIGRERRFRWVVPFVLVALVGVLLVARSYGLIHIGLESLESRLDYWRGARAIGRDHLWLGTGPGTFGSIYPKYKTASTEEPQLVHNCFLQMWSDSGVAADCTFTLLWLVAVRDGFKLARRRPGDAAAVAVCAAVAGWFIHSLVDFDLYVPGVAMPAFLLLGILQGLKDLPKADPVMPHGRTKWAIGSLCGVVVAVIVWTQGCDLLAAFAHARADQLRTSIPDVALEEASHAVELSPLNSHYCAAAGDIATQIGQFNTAIGYYQQAIHNDPYRASFHWRLARAEMAAHGLTDRALGQLREAVSLNPTQECGDPRRPCYREELAAAEESVRHSTNGLLQSRPAEDE